MRNASCAGPGCGCGLSRPMRVVSWVLQVIAAAILFQTLFFKFTGSEESRFIFGALGVEPWGRIGAGVTELAAVVLLLTPRTAVWGAGLSLGVICGALGAHLTVLGIEVKGDGGLLFGLALAVFAASAGVLVIRRAEVTRAVVLVRGRVLGRGAA